MWPWSPLNDDLQTHYAPFKIPKIAGLYEVGNAGAYTDTGAPIKPAKMSGVVGSVVTLARTRGFSSPHTNIIILDEIIPYQELLGNYDATAALGFKLSIIPYQELLGNYDW